MNAREIIRNVAKTNIQYVEDGDLGRRPSFEEMAEQVAFCCFSAPYIEVEVDDRYFEVPATEELYRLGYEGVCEVLTELGYQ